jgi:hypothetical protein
VKKTCIKHRKRGSTGSTKPARQAKDRQLAVSHLTKRVAKKVTPHKVNCPDKQRGKWATDKKQENQTSVRASNMLQKIQAEATRQVLKRQN